MNPTPVTFETWTLATPTLTTKAYTNETSVNLNVDGFDYSSYGKIEYNSTGGHTEIFTYNEPTLSFDGEVRFQTWIWGIVPAIVGKTFVSNFIGSSETIVSAVFLNADESDQITATALEVFIDETLASTPLTEVTFAQWSTTNIETNVTTTQSAQIQETVWTYNDNEWILSERPTSTQVTTLTGGNQQNITTYNITLTFDPEEARSTQKIIRSTATYNTLVLATSNTPNALTTTESADPQKESGSTEFYGGLTFNEEPEIVSFEDGIALVGGSFGYTTNLKSSTTTNPLSWTGTVLSNRPLAGIINGNNPPQVIDGEVIFTAIGGFPKNQEVTTTVEKNVLINGETTTSLASFETINLGPAQTTRSFSYTEIIDTFVETPIDDEDLRLAPAGFSIGSEGIVTYTQTFGEGETMTANASIEYKSLAVTVLPRVGFISSIADLQTSRINTLKFAVVGANNNEGTAYADTAFLNTITNKSLSFAPKSAQEYVPVSGSASSSSGQTSFSMSYYGTRQSRYTTIGSDTESQTSSWDVAGSPQTHWVHVSRNQVLGSPSLPTIPALIVAGTGQALLRDGLYETYSGDGSNRSSNSNFSVNVNSVTSFSTSEGVTAIKPLQYYIPITGNNAQTTSASFANNLTDQPVDD